MGCPEESLTPTSQKTKDFICPLRWDLKKRDIRAVREVEAVASWRIDRSSFWAPNAYLKSLKPSIIIDRSLMDNVPTNLPRDKACQRKAFSPSDEAQSAIDVDKLMPSALSLTLEAHRWADGIVQSDRRRTEKDQKLAVVRRSPCRLWFVACPPAIVMWMLPPSPAVVVLLLPPPPSAVALLLPSSSTIAYRFFSFTGPEREDWQGQGLSRRLRDEKGRRCDIDYFEKFLASVATGAAPDAEGRVRVGPIGAARGAPAQVVGARVTASAVSGAEDHCSDSPVCISVSQESSTPSSAESTPYQWVKYSSAPRYQGGEYRWIKVIGVSLVTLESRSYLYLFTPHSGPHLVSMLRLRLSRSVFSTYRDYRVGHIFKERNKMTGYLFEHSSIAYGLHMFLSAATIGKLQDEEVKGTNPNFEAMPIQFGRNGKRVSVKMRKCREPIGRGRVATTGYEAKDGH
ncbi:hypothetical protein PHJA_000122500 [Phtheirospermum japonicum]|uniref:Uncharacterized protein n=1 Tax=Phtheirospermum japonicum TaxID=374723 RepID=A0A830BCK4_9LAMI|nr:hypothetical protein PHJA_000122500 [Phtheirospermum japonicum]